MRRAPLPDPAAGSCDSEATEAIMRVYLPSTLPELHLALHRGEFGPAPIRAHAVTESLRACYAITDLEQLEYLALTAAARGSIRRLAADAGAPRRRVVVAAEVADALVEVGGQAEDRSQVLVRGTVPVAKVASGHVDDRFAVPDIERAVDALAGAAGESRHGPGGTDPADDHELLWYAVQELRYLFD